MADDNLAKKLHPLERKILPHIKKSSGFEELIERSGLKDVEAMRAVQWLENKGLVTIKSAEKEVISLDKNGIEYKKKGLPEKRFLESIKEKDKKMSILSKDSGLDMNEINISLGSLKKTGAIDIRKEDELIISITSYGKKMLSEKSGLEIFLEKKFPLDSAGLSKEDLAVLEDALKRKQIIKKERHIVRTVKLTKKGEEIACMDLSQDVIDKMTPKILKNKEWKEKEFRRYDVEINVPAVHGGKPHFTNQAIDYVKRIWLDLGFQEMTGSKVHTSFWDLDALFVPQDHPAREMQDTFYLKNPEKGRLPERELVKKIKKTHEDGWTTGSRGWMNDWDEEKAKENILRTHTTVLSAKTLHGLKKEDLPAKFFVVGKCFRNETLDWKHLFEFYQVEGIVVDEDANFRNLLGYLKNFFAKMGFSDVRIRPGHFPYTEPSAEIDVFHPVKKQWVEIGGSGIFRPEVTKPLLGFEVPVLAWGLGLGRIVKEYWEINDMRDLYKNDLKQLRELKLWLK